MDNLITINHVINISFFCIVEMYYLDLEKYFCMNRIKDILQEKGIKQTWLADRLGKSFNTVNGYVQNRQQPRLEVLNEIALILDIDVRELIMPTKDND